MDRFEAMKAFVQVVDSGGISAAADRLDIAKSAISRRLAELEQRLGVQLLKRSTRSISLTEQGSQYYQRCVRILAEVEESEQAVSSDSGALHGNIRLAAPLSFGIQHLSPLLDEFLHEHPALTLDIDLNDSQVNLLEAGFDLGIRIGRLEDSTLVARRICPMRAILCASPGYIEKYGEPRTPEELRQHTGLNYSNVADNVQWGFTRPDGTRVVARIPCRMRANNGQVLLQAAIDGLGVLASPSFIAYDAIQQQLVKPLMCEYQLDSFNVYAIYPAQRFLPHKIRVLIDFLRERLGDNPYWDIFTPLK